MRTRTLILCAALMVLLAAGVWSASAATDTTDERLIHASGTGEITTTDIKLSHADRLMIREDGDQWRTHSPDAPLVSQAMTIEFKAQDSRGENNEGNPYRIENSIDLYHDFMDSPTPGHKVVKIKVVPPSSTLLYTIDGANPANNGKPYRPPGIDAPEGATVRVHAAKGNITRDASFTVPRQPSGDRDDSPTFDPDLPVTVNGRAFTHLVSRSVAYQFLAALSAETRLQMVQAKVVHAATDNTVTLTWARKTQLTPQQLLTAFEFLDQQVPDGEWQLRFEQLHFTDGRSFLQWQVDTSTRIEQSQVTQ